jgi:hypothetical protein
MKIQLKIPKKTPFRNWFCKHLPQSSPKATKFINRHKAPLRRSLRALRRRKRKRIFLKKFKKKSMYKKIRA